MISYAQNFEDVMLTRVFQGVKEGFYVDVGAWDPVYDSVTKHFYDIGWRGINIEPHPGYFEKLLKARPRDITLNCAVGKQEEVRAFYLLGETGMSTLDPLLSEFFAAKAGLSEGQVQVRTLDSILEQAPGEIAFLKVDAEGWEEHVLASCNWSKHRPIVVVVEAIDPRDHAPTWGNWHESSKTMATSLSISTA
ncbi:MAG: FkbM family methyltransferase [Bryobacteraceae bacterium]